MVYYQVRAVHDLDRDRRVNQCAYPAQAGIGTYTSPQLVTSLGQAVSKTLDEAVAWNLDTHVMGALLHSSCREPAPDFISLISRV